MQINEECIRDVLLYCEDKIDYKHDMDRKMSLITVSLYELNNSNLSKKYDEKDIMYSVMKLEEIGFIITSDKYPKEKSVLERCTIAEITYRGHQFLDTIKPEPIWDKTKNVIKSVGNHTLNFIESTAHDIAVETAKQAVTVMMTTKQ